MIAADEVALARVTTVAAPGFVEAAGLIAAVKVTLPRVASVEALAAILTRVEAGSVKLREGRASRGRLRRRGDRRRACRHDCAGTNDQGAKQGFRHCNIPTQTSACAARHASCLAGAQSARVP
ncbi:hypothetical protein CHELA20_50310 [Hyphomicrobiales bacterium]|nr:hypothetical protein CHELA41_20063 [Hyphomicrobiales bacterium]CAH1668149.1 hypothetical protein CHELA20_50310 [Hyphomicrobiales bacterium]